ATVTVMVTDTLLTILPANIEIGIGNNFNLDIVLRKAKEFDSAGVYLSFDPNILEVTGLTHGPFPQDGNVIISQFNNESGTIDYAVGLTSGTAQGTGTVLTIGFKAKAIMGTTTLSFNFDPPRNTDILKETESLSFTATEGKIIIFPCGSLDGYVLFDIPRQNPHAGIEIGIAGTELRATTTDTGYFLIDNIPPMTYPQVFAYAPGASPGYWGSVTITAGTKTTLSTLTLLNADANGDCMVSLKDFGCLKRAFLKTNTDSRWYDSDYHKRDGYINSDFNGDDAVSLKDFGYLKSNFLHTTTLYRSPLCALPLGRLLDGESAILKVVPEKREMITGAEFDINIDLLHAPTLDSVGAYLSFDPQALEVISLTQGTFPVGGSPLISQFNNGSGTIDYAVGLTSGTTQGTGTVLTIKLKAKGTGTTTLNFDSNSPRNTEMFNGIATVPLSTQIGVITINAESLFSVEISATPATILKGGTATLTIIPRDKNGNVIQSPGTVTLSNLTSSISTATSNIQATTTLTATITLSPNGGWDVLTATVTIGTSSVSGTCSILVLLPKGKGEVSVALPAGTATAKGTFTDNFWIGIEDRSDAETLTLLANQIGVGVEITMGTETGVITGTLPTTIFVEIPFDPAKLRNINRSTLKLWIYRDGGWHEIEDSGVYLGRDIVWGRITHLTLFGISGMNLFAPNLTDVFAYPNPCRIYEGNRQITFKKLTAQANIKIFNIVGELIKEIEHTDGKDEEVWTIPAEIASGMYIYLITNDKEQKDTGKFGIIK
ncbi:MAG: T9SS type A sorting domain-containing protein, partial [bacterium]